VVSIKPGCRYASKETDNYLKVRMQFFDLNDHSIAGNIFKQNELIIIQISLEKTFSMMVDTIFIKAMER